MLILLVEDNQVNRLVAERMLRKLGHEVVAVENGEDAVSEAGNRVFDLIIMDVQMPIMDGIAATRAIRDGNGPSAKAPILAMTAHALTDNRAEMLEAGMDDFLSKPIDMAVLGEVLDHYRNKMRQGTC